MCAGLQVAVLGVGGGLMLPGGVLQGQVDTP